MPPCLGTFNFLTRFYGESDGSRACDHNLGLVPGLSVLPFTALPSFLISNP